jgi:hypothetical protein
LAVVVVVVVAAAAAIKMLRQLVNKHGIEFPDRFRFCYY